MTAAFAVAGIAQAYLERKMGLDFMEVQKEIEVHFFVLVLAATMFTVGVLLFVWNFLKFGQPTDEALVTES